MAAFALASVGILLSSLILVRAIQRKTFGEYPYFYSYAISVSIGSIALWPVRAAHPLSYLQYYWPLQLVTLVFGYGIILEIFRHVLSPYPGVGRFARTLGMAVLAALFAFSLVYPHLLSAGAGRGTYVELERGLRAMQAILLVCILTLVFHYEISIGRNMKGLILGYGIYVGSSLVSLAVEAYAGTWLVQLWRNIQPISFDLSLFIWLVALWSYAPNPVSDHRSHLEQDYETLALRTKALIDSMRSYLFKAVDP